MNIVFALICFVCCLFVRTEALIDGLYCGRENCYDLLNVTRSSSKQEIVKAYRLLAKKFHPDMAKNAVDREKFTETFRAFANAYEILKDEETRNDYDRMLDNPEQYVVE
jgi:DnaJ homolog subfamily C member 25